MCLLSGAAGAEHTALLQLKVQRIYNAHLSIILILCARVGEV